MKPWAVPDTSDLELKYLLYSWWDSLADWERSETLIKELVNAGIDIKGLIIKKDLVSNC
ncbi:MAG: hypothetical protein QX191_04460 [Methylococcaceae bacterium]